MDKKLSNKEWREFFISDIFTKIKRGKRLTKSHQQDGNMPYISSTAANNGVDNFIGNSSGVRMFENCLTLANSGSVGATFFHHYTFVASDHVTALMLEKSNKYIYLFLSGIIRRLEEKYSFNREINDKRIQREKILLPVNSDGLPDWQFMEDFMKEIERNKISAILNYYNNSLNNNDLRGRLGHRLKADGRHFRYRIFVRFYPGRIFMKESAVQVKRHILLQRPIITASVILYPTIIRLWKKNVFPSTVTVRLAMLFIIRIRHYLAMMPASYALNAKINMRPYLSQRVLKSRESNTDTVIKWVLNV